MTRKRWLWLAGAAALVVVIVLVVRAATPATRFVYGLGPVSRDEALLLTRRNDDDGSAFWVQLVRTDGSVTWSAETSPFETADALSFSGIAATDERIVLLGERSGSTSVMARARASGEPVWETTVSPEVGPNRIGPMLIVDGPRIYALHERKRGEHAPETVTALTLADGAVVWTLPPPEEDYRRIDVTLLAPGRLLVSGPERGIVERNGASGEVVRSWPELKVGCETPQGLIAHGAHRVTLLPRAGDAPAGADLGPDLRPGWHGPCGLRGADAVIATEKSTIHDSGLARLDPVGGSVRWQLSLGPWIFDDAVAVDGRLPRFLPVAVYGGPEKDGPLKYEAVVVDLDLGVIHARHPSECAVLPFVTGERAYLLTSGYPAALLALDPASGELASATSLSGVFTREVRSEELRFGRLWMTGTDYRRPADLAWLVIDLETAKPTGLNGDIAPVDVTAQGWAVR